MWRYGIQNDAIKILEQLGHAFTGVGDKRSVCEHGAYSVRLPLLNSNDATSLCLDKVMTDFPITHEIKSMCENEGENLNCKDLPTLPNQVGEQTDIIIGLKYKKYFHKEIHIFPLGLTVYSSQFKGVDGTVGVLGGPHPELTKEARYTCK